MPDIDVAALGDSIQERHNKGFDQVEPPTDSLYVDGTWVEPKSGDYLETKDPATGEHLTLFPVGNAVDIDRAVSAAREAYENWSKTSTSERRSILEEVATLVEHHRDELALVETLDNGKPITEARADIDGVVRTFRKFAGLVEYNHGRSVSNSENQIGQTVREPYGVAGLIVPWNFPLSIATMKLAPALAAGNTTVLKPAEQTPLSVLKLMELVGNKIPDGVVNVVTGTGESAGRPLAKHSDVDKLSFTGSVQVGKEVMRSAASDVTDVTLELGGKSPVVVFPDVEIDAAADIARKAIFFNTGECCTAGSRLLIHSDIYDSLLEKLVKKTKELTIGDPLREETDVGPETSAAQAEQTQKYVDRAIKTNPTVVLDRSVDDVTLSSGYFIGPTIISDIEASHETVQDEVFGPVLTVFQWESYDEMISLANDVDYGLAASVLTTDTDQAYRTAKDIQAGYVWINEYHVGAAGLPTGGYKESGIGREGAIESLRDFTQIKSIDHRLSTFD